MNEIWKDIEFTDNKYAVSNLGNVKRNEHYTTIGPTKNRKESSTIFSRKAREVHLKLQQKRLVWVYKNMQTKY